MGENAERIRAAMEAFNERDFEPMAELSHPDIEWTPPPELPGSRTYHGLEGVREAIADMLDVFADLRAEPVRLIEDGERVVGLYVWRGRGAGSGASLDLFETKAGFVCDFEDGLARVVRFWVSWDEALDAAGLSRDAAT